MSIIDNHCQLATLTYMSMNVNLTAELDALVRGKVKSGLYNSASEVVRDALRLLAERDELKARKLELGYCVTKVLKRS